MNLSRRTFASGIAIAVLFTATSAVAIGKLNTPEGGYLLCVDSKTKIVTFPNSQLCAKGQKALILGMKGDQGVQGIQGLQGAEGIRGLTGEKGETGAAGLPGMPGASGGTGPQGPAGANHQLVVRDSAGTFIGYVTEFFSSSAPFNDAWSGNMTTNAVRIWEPNTGLTFGLNMSGRPLTSYMLFSGAGCTGTAYLSFSDAVVGATVYSSKYLAFSDSPTGAIRWYQKATQNYILDTITITSAPHYSDSCEAGSEFGTPNFTGAMAHVVLTPTTSPLPTIVGPLVISVA